MAQKYQNVPVVPNIIDVSAMNTTTNKTLPTNPSKCIFHYSGEPVRVCPCYHEGDLLTIVCAHHDAGSTEAKYYYVFEGNECTAIYNDSNVPSWVADCFAGGGGSAISEAFEIVDLGTLTSFSGTFPDGTYTVPTTSGNTVFYDAINAIWTAGKIPVVKFSLQSHTASFSLPLFKNSSNDFNGHERGDNGDYTIDVVIGSSSGNVKTRSIVLASTIGDINTLLDSLNGETI